MGLRMPGRPRFVLNSPLFKGSISRYPVDQPLPFPLIAEYRIREIGTRIEWTRQDLGHLARRLRHRIEKRSPRRRMTDAQIFKWLTDTFLMDTVFGGLNLDADANGNWLDAVNFGAGNLVAMQDSFDYLMRHPDESDLDVTDEDIERAKVLATHFADALYGLESYDPSTDPESEFYDPKNPDNFQP